LNGISFPPKYEARTCTHGLLSICALQLDLAKFEIIEIIEMVPTCAYLELENINAFRICGKVRPQKRQPSLQRAT